MSIKLTGDQYIGLDGKLAEIKRQMRQPDGYPFDPEGLSRLLQRAIEGRWYENYLVDLDADPFISKDLKVESHTKGGKIPFNPNMVDLYLSDEQKKGSIQGNDLCKKIETKNPYNANMLDFYLAHRELIPESWKGQYVFFFGTVYRLANGDLCVRCLFWFNSLWHWYYRRLIDRWSVADSSVVPGPNSKV
jgi:hypothetical protein